MNDYLKFSNRKTVTQEFWCVVDSKTNKIIEASSFSHMHPAIFLKENHAIEEATKFNYFIDTNICKVELRKFVFFEPTIEDELEDEDLDKLEGGI